MKPNELRIGNLVLIPEMHSPIKIPVCQKQVKGITKFGELDFTEPQYPEPLVVPAKLCCGIDLTEEWLLKFGFEVVYNSDITKRYDLTIDERFDFLINKHDEKLSGIRFKGNTFYQEVKSVHQLQNLYFALTGNELKTTEP